MGVAPGLSRRQLLRTLGAAGVAWPLAACAGVDESGPGRRPAAGGLIRSGSGDDPDVTLVVAAIGDEEALLDLCIELTPSRYRLTATVEPLKRSQRHHIETLRGALTATDPPPSTRETAAPPNRPAGRAALLEQVERARDGRRRDCLAARSGLLARLLAAMSASHAVTAAALRGPP